VTTREGFSAAHLAALRVKHLDHDDVQQLEALSADAARTRVFTEVSPANEWRVYNETYTLLHAAQQRLTHRSKALLRQEREIGQLSLATVHARYGEQEDENDAYSRTSVSGRDRLSSTQDGDAPAQQTESVNLRQALALWQVARERSIVNENLVRSRARLFDLVLSAPAVWLDEFPGAEQSYLAAYAKRQQQLEEEAAALL
jgi:hypothetical protein